MDGFFRPAMKWVRTDPNSRSAFFQMRDHQVVQVLPPALHRSLNVVRKEFKSAKTGAQVISRPGNAVYEIRFKKKADLAAFMADYREKPMFSETVSVQWNTDEDAVDIIPAGVGFMLLPEVRAYKKHSSPTTEVAIHSKVYEDVYVAMRPALGQAFVNMLVVVFPLVSLLWTGALVMIIGGIICLLPSETAGSLFRAGPKPAAAGGMLMVGMPLSKEPMEDGADEPGESS